MWYLLLDCDVRPWRMCASGADKVVAHAASRLSAPAKPAATIGPVGPRARTPCGGVPTPIPASVAGRSLLPRVSATRSAQGVWPESTRLGVALIEEQQFIFCLQVIAR